MPQIDSSLASDEQRVDMVSDRWVIRPILGQWYSSLSKYQPFQVVAVADDYVQVRYADDYHERIWLDDWSDLEPEFMVPRSRVPARHNFAKRSCD